MIVKWTPLSEESFEDVIEFIQVKWGKREIEKFAKQTEKIIRNISINPFMYKSTVKDKNIRNGLINKLISVIYRVNTDKNEIELLLFWDNRKDPKKIKY